MKLWEDYLNVIYQSLSDKFKQNKFDVKISREEFDSRDTGYSKLYQSPVWWFLGRDTRGTRLLRRRSHSARLCWNWCSVERNGRSRRGLDQPRWKPCTARTSRVKTTREFTHCSVLSSPLLLRADLGTSFFFLSHHQTFRNHFRMNLDSISQFRAHFAPHSKNDNVTLQILLVLTFELYRYWIIGDP